MLTPTALMNPTITALDTKRSIDPQLQQPGHQHHRAGEHRQRDQRPGRIARVADDGHVGDEHRHGAGALDGHERRAGARTPRRRCRPCSRRGRRAGSRPASSPVARPSGTDCTPSTSPATASWRNVRSARSVRCPAGVGGPAAPAGSYVAPTVYGPRAAAVPSAAWSRPNVLLIMTDEERYPPPYETAAVAEFRRDPAARLGSGSATAASSCTATTSGSTACVPSRATLFTGQYPSLHGVSQTDGVAKHNDDPAHAVARPRRGAHAGRLVPRRRLPDPLPGQVARQPRGPARARHATTGWSRPTTTVG